MLQIIKNKEISSRKKAAIHLAAIFLALLTASVFILFMGHPPLKVYLSMARGAFGTSYRFTETLIKTIPLIITSLGISLAFRMKFWNIGAEGQIIMGAFGASWVALSYPHLPSFVLLPLMGLGGLAGGGIWALIPAFFRARFQTNETIFTLMLNYIALQWITYLQNGPWKDPGALGFPKIPNFSPQAVLPKLFGIHIGWLIAFILVVLSALFITKTKKGYEIQVIGESEKTARYAGINVSRTILVTLFISGALCGLAGMIEASAINKTLSVEITGGVGYTAIITAWLANLKELRIVLVSFLFAAMIQGSSYIQMAFQIPQSAAQILQGLILFFVLGSEFFIRYRIVYRSRESGGGET
ncbi:MAG TPA: ABC transporter permease [Firmicutes bacterium]|nr:ABC transporter permease [Bacillota bacterium]